MFVVTNRVIQDGAKGLKKFGEHPNPKGPNELRLVEVTKSGRSWDTKILKDECTPAMKREVALPAGEKAYASQYVARKVLSRVRGQKKNLLFFIHGYNNNMKAVLDRAHYLATTYNLEVIAFSWPANGGGVRGVADYLSDKRDARASAGALERCLEKFHAYLKEFNQAELEKIYVRAEDRYGDDPERRDRFITEQSVKACPFTVNMLLHSMGNYLYKQVMDSTASEGKGLIFDNVVMAAADTNNEDHARWVDQIKCRRRVYITINEDDGALRASRIKSGQEQRARLGHYPYNLYASSAVYVDVTDAKYVGNSHAYFEKGAIRNLSVKRFFTSAFNGSAAEGKLDYNSATKMYRIS